MYFICFIFGFLSSLFICSIVGFMLLYRRWKPIVDAHNTPSEEEDDKKTIEEQYQELFNYQPRYGND